MQKNFIDKFKRKPDFIVYGKGADKEVPYLKRWWLIPRNRFFNVYLHQFLNDDDARAMHDHPWKSLSLCLKGRYKEHLLDGRVLIRKKGKFVYRSAEHAHRIELFKTLLPDEKGWRKTSETEEKILLLHTPEPAWTIFITGPNIREWGYHCEKGWRHNEEFNDPQDPGKVGKGCAE